MAQRGEIYASLFHYPLALRLQGLRQANPTEVLLRSNAKALGFGFVKRNIYKRRRVPCAFSPFLQHQC